MPVKKNVMDLTLGKVGFYWKLFTDRGGSIELLQELERRPYLITRGIEAFKSLIEEDTYESPMILALQEDGDWQTIDSPTSAIPTLHLKLLEDVLPDGKYHFVAHGLPDQKVFEVVVGKEAWEYIGNQTQIRHIDGRQFWIRRRREFPLYAPQPV